MLRVYSLEELFDAAETLSHYAAAGGEDAGEARLAMVTNGGGLGVLATDALVDEGGKLAELAPETIAALDAALPATWSRRNPVDIIADAPGTRYKAALLARLDAGRSGAVLALHCPVAVAEPTDAARAAREAGRREDGYPQKPVYP